MISTPLTQTSFEPVTHLKQGAREKDPEAIRQVAKQFESLFVQMMLKSMRDTVPENELFGSNAERMYRDMYDKQLSMQISNGKGIGLANVIERQLGGTPEGDVKTKRIEDYLANPKAFAFEQSLNSPIIKRAMEDARMQVEKLKPSADIKLSESTQSPEMPESEKMQGPWQSAEDYINDVWPHALRASEKLGIDADVLMAQSALETGWGKHLPVNADGSNSYNLFGIKADHRWQGDKVEITTREFRHGVMQQEKSSFRSYGSVAEAFEDYADFIMNSPRYQKALEHGYDGEAYARELQKAGYATDPDYASKINRVRTNDDLQNKVAELKKINIKNT